MFLNHKYHPNLLLSSQYPHAVVIPSRVTISQGSSVELRCETTGIPPPTVKWSKVDDASGQMHNVEQSGPILYIRNAQFADRGVYVCVADNIHGLSQDSSIVEVNRKYFFILEIVEEVVLFNCLNKG